MDSIKSNYMFKVVMETNFNLSLFKTFLMVEELSDLT